MSTCFVLDMVLSFITGFYEEDAQGMMKFVSEPRAIARRYFHSWFVIDAFAVLPVFVRERRHLNELGGARRARRRACTPQNLERQFSRTSALL